MVKKKTRKHHFTGSTFTMVDIPDSPTKGATASTAPTQESMESEKEEEEEETPPPSLPPSPPPSLSTAQEQAYSDWSIEIESLSEEPPPGIPSSSSTKKEAQVRFQRQRSHSWGRSFISSFRRKRSTEKEQKKNAIYKTDVALPSDFAVNHENISAGTDIDDRSVSPHRKKSENIEQGQPKNANSASEETQFKGFRRLRFDSFRRRKSVSTISKESSSLTPSEPADEDSTKKSERVRTQKETKGAVDQQGKSPPPGKTINKTEKQQEVENTTSSEIKSTEQLPQKKMDDDSEFVKIEIADGPNLEIISIYSEVPEKPIYTKPNSSSSKETWGSLFKREKKIKNRIDSQARDPTDENSTFANVVDKGGKNRTNSLGRRPTTKDIVKETNPEKHSKLNLSMFNSSLKLKRIRTPIMDPSSKSEGEEDIEPSGTYSSTSSATKRRGKLSKKTRPKSSEQFTDKPLVAPKVGRSSSLFFGDRFLAFAQNSFKKKKSTNKPSVSIEKEVEAPVSEQPSHLQDKLEDDQILMTSDAPTIDGSSDGPTNNKFSNRSTEITVNSEAPSPTSDARAAVAPDDVLESLMESPITRDIRTPTIITEPQDNQAGSSPPVDSQLAAPNISPVSDQKGHTTSEKLPDSQKVPVTSASGNNFVRNRDLVSEALEQVFSSPLYSVEGERLRRIFENPHLKSLLETHDSIIRQPNSSEELQIADLSSFDWGLVDTASLVDEEHWEMPADVSAVRVVSLRKSPAEPLGLTVKTEDGQLVIARILGGGAVDRQGLLHVGDVIGEVNGIPVRSAEQLQVEIARCKEHIQLKILPSFHEGGSNGAQMGQCPNTILASETLTNATVCCVRAHFDYDPKEDKLLPCPEIGLAFKKGDILQVVNQSDPNWWQAKKVGWSGPAGLIPSQELEERRKAFVAPEADFVHKIGFCGTRISKKKKKLMYQIKSSVELDKAELLLYEEVTRMPPFRRKSLVLVGSEGIGRRTLKNRLINSDPDRFGTTMPHTSRPMRELEEDGMGYWFVSREEMEHDIRDHQFLECGEHNGQLYGTKLDSIRTIIRQGKMCVLDCSPNALKILHNSPEFMPYVIFLAAPGMEQLKSIYENSRYSSRNLGSGTFDRSSSIRFSSRRARTLESLTSLYEEEDFKRALEESARIQRTYEKYFDQIIINDDPDQTFRKVVEALEILSNQHQWVPVSWVY